MSKSPEEINEMRLDLLKRIKKASNEKLDLNPEEVKLVITKRG